MRIRSIFLRISLLCLILPVVLFFFVVGMVLHGMKGTATLPADCAIVFGAAVHPLYESGAMVGLTAGPGIARRVDTAVDLYRKGLVHRLFLTGGKGEGMDGSEARVMEKRALRAGVKKLDIVLEGESRSTEENIRNTHPLVKDCSSVIALSDAYHLARIRYLASLQGWTLPTYPAATHPNRLFELTNVFRESLGIIYATVH